MFNIQRAALVAVGATLAAVSLAACKPDSASGEYAAKYTDPNLSYVAPTSEMPIAPTTTTAPNPLTTDGRWLIGTGADQIAAGTYRATPHGYNGTGYYEVCADLACEIGTPGFIKNDFLTGPDFIVIPPNAVAVKVQDLTLTRADN
ncbi:hypothetical protein [Nocardia vaccinii]|uniref:hypothetical protein n=1 Tax=Nocardia vaccinii TaxID=1822 RepID=UPI0008338491|nr:hypothetical protein [Nocardia vaccinii]